MDFLDTRSKCLDGKADGESAGTKASKASGSNPKVVLWIRIFFYVNRIWLKKKYGSLSNFNVT